MEMRNALKEVLSARELVEALVRGPVTARQDTSSIRLVLVVVGPKDTVVERFESIREGETELNPGAIVIEGLEEFTGEEQGAR